MKRAVVMLVLGALACSPSGPVAVPSDQIPFELSRSFAPQQSEQVTLRFRLALVRKGRVLFVARSTSTRLAPPETIVEALLDGPTIDETGRGFRTEIPAAASLLSVEVNEQIATVDLTQEFQQAGSAASFQLRVAQVVFSLVSLDEIVAVRFSIEGRLVSVPTDRGRIVEAPVRADDYERLRPRR